MGGAAEPQPSGKGGKKAMDAAINLVPYIDLLMTIMTFLVMTAVWTQIAALEVQNASGNAPQEPDPNDKPPPALFVLVSSTEVKVQEEGKEAKVFPNVDGVVDRVKIGEDLMRLLKDVPERHDVKVKSEPDVLFENVAEVIDIATGTCIDKNQRDTCLYQITLNPV